MYFTYILRCFDLKRNRIKFYIGSTENLEKRVEYHKSKSVSSTKHFNIINLIYYEACLNKTDARKREIQLKTGFGRGFLKRRLANCLKRRA